VPGSHHPQFLDVLHRSHAMSKTAAPYRGVLVQLDAAA
jgi:hypothetical protein